MDIIRRWDSRKSGFDSNLSKKGYKVFILSNLPEDS